ncbi:hypothetical protein Tco_0420699, partial [Tanacetum coccineum]
KRDWDPIDPVEATARAWTITDPEVDLLLKWSHHHILKKKVAATESISKNPARRWPKQSFGAYAA